MHDNTLDAETETSIARAPKPCLICDDPSPAYEWTDYSGEATCMRCGTPYQIKWDQLEPGESYPRINAREDAIPMLRRYWDETRNMSGGGTFLILRDYPRAIQGQRDFSAWWAKHRDEYPQFAHEEETE